MINLQTNSEKSNLNESFPLCSIVIITYNGKELLEKYFPSITNLAYPKKEIIVVDNCSTDNTAEFLKENFPAVSVITTNENVGTAEGSNIGARAAKGDFILWLHNDMYLPPSTLENLMKKILSSEKIGICTCKVKKMNENGKELDIIDSVGGGLDRYGFPTARGMGEKDEQQYDSIKKTFFAFGGPLLIRKSVFDKLKGMDPYTFTLVDDIDLCWRCWLLGYEVIVDPSTVIYHRLSATLSSFTRENKRYMSERNTLRMLIKNYSMSNLIKILPTYLIIITSEIIFFTILGKKKLAIADLRSIGWNLKNLKNTLHERKKIQAQRIVSDKKIISHMKSNSYKLEYFRDYLKNRNEASWSSYFNSA